MSFLEIVCYTLVFSPTRADPDLWYRKYDDYEGYDYIATDNIIITAKRPAECMSQIKQQFNVRNKENLPSYYLGHSYKRDDKGNIHVSSTKYINVLLDEFRDLYVVIKISILEEVSSLLEPVKLLYFVDIEQSVRGCAEDLSRE